MVIDDPVLQEGCRRLPLANWDRAWETLVTRAEARGEVPAGAGRSVAAEVGPAVLALRWLVTGRPLDGAVVTELVDRVVLPLPLCVAPEARDGDAQLLVGSASEEVRVNLEKVVFGFFVLLAATLNFGFFIGDIDRPELHNRYELFAAVIVNLIATVLKFGDRTQIGAVHLATSLVASLQLVAAALMYGYAEYVSTAGMTPGWTASVVSVAGGALLANLVSVVLLVIETVSFHRG